MILQLFQCVSYNPVDAQNSLCGASQWMEKLLLCFFPRHGSSGVGRGDAEFRVGCGHGVGYGQDESCRLGMPRVELGGLQGSGRVRFWLTGRCKVQLNQAGSGQVARLAQGPCPHHRKKGAEPRTPGCNYGTRVARAGIVWFGRG